jgi:carboxymethylenebutenolidase
VCHDDDSRPPGPADPVELAAHGPLELVAADGNRLTAYEAHPGPVSDRGIVILPDVRGLHEFYRDLARRFAEAGLHALAVDYFGRTADSDVRGDSFDHAPHVKQTTPQGVAADVAAGVGHLRSPAGGAVASVFTVGFCFGGGYSLRQAAEQPGLAGSIGFYGQPSRALELSDAIAAPLLVLLAGADQNISVDETQQLVDVARGHGLEADLVVYDGAPHSFFDRSYAEHAQACADAWVRIAAFVDRHSA